MTGEGRRSGKVEKSLRSVIQTVRGCSYGDVQCQLPWKLKQNSRLGERRACSAMRRVTAVGFAFLFVSTAASAQTASKGNISFGYSYVRADLSPKSPLSPRIGNSNLHGWYISAEYKLIPWFGAVADFGGTYGTERVVPFCEVIIVCQGPLNAQTNVHTFLFGPRAAVSIGRYTPFAQALFGIAHTGASGTGFSNSDTFFATVLGGGVDFRLARTIGWRVQADQLQTHFFSNSQNNFRFSTGPVIRF